MTGTLYQHQLGWVDNPNHDPDKPMMRPFDNPTLCLGVLTHINLDEAVALDTRLNMTYTVNRPHCYDCDENIDDVSAAQRMVACEDGCHIKFRCESCKNTRKVVKTWEVPSLPVRIPSVLV